MVDWVHTDSEAIESYRYDAMAQRLLIRFSTGGLYEYFNATPSLYSRLQKADSKGVFFSKFIRDKLRFRRVN